MARYKATFRDKIDKKVEKENRTKISKNEKDNCKKYTEGIMQLEKQLNSTKLNDNLLNPIKLDNLKRDYSTFI